MKWKTSIACLLIILLFAIPAWCDNALDIRKINEEINVDFEKTDVKKVLTILVEPANLDIAFDKCVQGSVTIKVENVPLHNLFRMILEYAGLDYEQDGDKIWITCQDGPEKSGDSANVGMVYDQSEVDTPPQVLRLFPPQYPYEAKKNHIEGRVVVRFLVDTDGNAKEPEVVEFVPEEAAIFKTPALMAIEQYKFKPAMLNGEPVACIVRMPLSFELE